MKPIGTLAAFLALCAGPALAQDWSEPLRYDLDRDGVEEAYALRDEGGGHVALVVAGPEGTVAYSGVARLGPEDLDLPALLVGETGELVLSSPRTEPRGGFWDLSVTLEPGRGGLEVVAWSWSWSDTGADGVVDYLACSVDLRTGQAIQTAEGAERRFALAPGVIPLSDWTYDRFEPPPGCPQSGASR